jgi:hypothetical protein
MKFDKIVWSIIAFIVVVFMIAIYATRNATTFENLDQEINQREKIIDSLEQEIFAKDVQLGRYEFAIELLEENDSGAAAKFEEVLNMTE